MKLDEVYSKPLKEVIEELELSNIEIHTDNDGTIKEIELKYTEKESKPESEKMNNPW